MRASKRLQIAKRAGRNFELSAYAYSTGRGLPVYRISTRACTAQFCAGVLHQCQAKT